MAKDLIEELLEEASAAADRQNGKVIFRAMTEASIHCQACDYPENAERFDDLLFRYISVRLSLHKLSRRLERMYDDCDIRLARQSPSTSDVYKLSVKVDELEKERKMLREELHSIFPCNQCRTWYNPTRRLRLLLHRKPVACPPTF